MPTIGSSIAVSQSLPATLDQAGFSALAYTPIRGAKSVGEIGKQYQTVTVNPIGAPRPYQMRTGLAAASLPVELIRIADAGQTILMAAIDATASYSYRVSRIDGSALYFTAKTSSRMHGGFAPSQLADTKVTLEIDSIVVEV